MSAIKDYMGADYERWLKDGSNAAYMGVFLHSASKDELLAVIGQQGEERAALRALAQANIELSLKQR